MIRFLWTSLPSRNGINTLALRWSPVRFHTLFESMALEHPLNRSDKKAKYKVLGSFHLTSHLFVSGILITLSYHPTYVVCRIRQLGHIRIRQLALRGGIGLLTYQNRRLLIVIRSQRCITKIGSSQVIYIADPSGTMFRDWRKPSHKRWKKVQQKPKTMILTERFFKF